MTTTNPTDLKLSFTPPAIQGFDAIGLKAWALDVKEKYAGLVITEDQAVGAKTEIAELRRIAKQLNDSRIAAVKQVSEPIRDFEAQIKEVAGIFLETADGIASQVKNHEERAREEKRQEVLTAIAILTEEAGYPGLEIPVQDSWLNKSQKPKQTAADIQAFIFRHEQALKAAAAAEQAKQDRAVAIEQQNAALAQGYGFTLPLSQFYALHNLETSLVQVNETMTEAYRAKAEAMKKAAQHVPVTPYPVQGKDVFGRSPLPPVNMTAMQDQAPAQPTVSVGQIEKNITVSLRFAPFRENEVNAALRHLEELGVSVVLVTPAYESREIIPQTRARNY